MIKTKTQFGFTLIELLVVVAIIGMLTSVIMVSFGHTRMRSRDTKRLSDAAQLRTGLDLFFNTANGYPDPSMWATGQLSCNGTAILTVPKDPLLQIDYNYQTDSASITDCGVQLYRDYYVEITTESDTDLGPGGTYYVSRNGISSVAPF
jgi:prepilin-type N-terminal cleavage/methylation domain-containing protein